MDDVDKVSPMIVPEHVARLIRGGFDRQHSGDLFLWHRAAPAPLGAAVGVDPYHQKS